MNRTTRSRKTNAVLITLSFILLAGTVIYAYSFKMRAETSAEKDAAAKTGGGLSTLSEEMEKEASEELNLPVSEDEEYEAHEELPKAVSEKENGEAIAVKVSVEGFDIADAVWPVQKKDIVMSYSYNTEPVYSKTFGEYRSDHAGIDISAENGESVKCAYDGKVKEIRFDARLGMSVFIDHGSGIVSQYSNLADNVSVTLSQTVKKGDEIGRVGASAAYETKEAPHLHFAVSINGDYVNPCDYFKLD